MKNFKLLLLISLLFVCGNTAYAQSRVYTGIVRDATNGEALPNVNVIILAGGTGTSGDENGNFSIEVAPGTEIEFSSVGYKPQKMVTGKKTTLQIFLQPQVAALNEVVVLSYGSAQRKALTGSVSTLNKNIISKQQVSTVSKALEGTVTGVQLTSKSGQPGDDAGIQIRGLGSLNAGAGALIVVDGVPYNFGLSSINPNDIESVVVSKDATANSLYGSRAANGVVIITTKKGNKGKANINFQMKLGANTRAIPNMDVVRDPAQYYEYAWQAIYNKALDDMGDDSQARQYASTNLIPKLNNYMNYAIPEGTTLVEPSTGKLNPDARLLYHDDWEDILLSPAFRQEYNFSISGGNQKTDYYMSIGYLNDPSYVIGSEFHRYSARFNINSQVNTWLKAGMSGAYSNRYSNAPNYAGGTVSNNVFTFIGLLAPIVPYYAYDENGNVRIDPTTGEAMYDKGTGQTLSPYGPTKRPFFSGYHPGIFLDKDLTASKYDDFSLQGYAEADLTHGFTFKVNVDMANSFRTYTQYGNNEDGPSARDENGSIAKTHDKTRVINTNQILSYNKKLKKHSFEALAGHEFYYSQKETLNAQKTDMFATDMPELDNAVKLVSSGSSTYEEALEGFFTKLNYNFDEKYYLSGSYRADGTSRFKYDKWGHFWSVGAAWRLSEEDFLRNVVWIDELKLRASYGTQGNQAVSGSNFPYTDLWNVSNQNGEAGITMASIGNRNLSWEKNRIVDAGLDFRFDDRVYGSLDYFYRKTKDLIWSRPMPISTGMGSRLENVGELANYGWEFELGVNIIKDRSVFWSVGFNLSNYKNELLKLPSELSDGYITDIYKREVGKDYYNLYMYEYAGVNPENGNPLLYALKDGQKVTTEKKEEATKFEVGTATPKLIGGINTNVKWKGFDLSIISSYQIGGKVMSPEYSYTTSQGKLTFNIHKDLLNAWTPENRNTDVPKAYEGQANITDGSTRYLFDASYFNLKNVTLSYDLPWRWCNKLKLTGVNISLSADNLWFKSVKQGIDPRSNRDGKGSNSFSFQQPRTISAGLSINL